LRPWREAIGFKASRTAPANNIFCIALICSSFCHEVPPSFSQIASFFRSATLCG
jgi:hypothetical protein